VALHRRINAASWQPDLSGLAPAAQFAVWRVVRESRRIDEGALDRAMTKWLLTLASWRESRISDNRQERSVMYG